VNGCFHIVKLGLCGRLETLIFSVYFECQNSPTHTEGKRTVNQRPTAVATGWSKKTDTQFYFWDNAGNSAPILSLLQAEIYGA